MKTKRDQILASLLRRPRQTIRQLAEAIGINPVSVRHHLSNLQVEGLIAADEERHGVGRPRLVYALTEDGMEKFPTKYLRLTMRLLAQMKETMPGPVVRSLFGQVADDLASEYVDQIQDLTIEQRLEFVKDLLAREGFPVEWDRHGEEYHIHEISCPYYHIGVAHPEVCTVDQTVISRMLALPASKIQCVLDGATHCTYVVRLPGASTEMAGTNS